MPFPSVHLRLSLAYALALGAEPRVALVQRSVLVSSFAPRDPTAQPFLGFTTHLEGIDRCALFNDGVLRPSGDQADNIEFFIETVDSSNDRWGANPDGTVDRLAEGEC